MTRKNTIALQNEYSHDQLSAKLARVYDLLEIFEGNRERGGKCSWGYVINELRWHLGESYHGR